MIILTLCYRENYEGEIDNKWQILYALQRFPLEYLWLSRKKNDCLEKVHSALGGSEWKLSISVEKFTSISSVWEIQREAKTSELKIVSFWSDLILLI